MSVTNSYSTYSEITEHHQKFRDLAACILAKQNHGFAISASEEWFLNYMRLFPQHLDEARLLACGFEPKDIDTLTTFQRQPIDPGITIPARDVNAESQTEMKTINDISFSVQGDQIC